MATADLVPTRNALPARSEDVSVERMLDVYGGGEVDAVGRPPILATISAGKRGEDRGTQPGYPEVSRDGRIYLHDDEGNAPGLKAALNATDGKRLTIAFPTNERRALMQQRFTRYSQTRLEVYGDGEALYEVTAHEEPGPNGRKRLVADGHVRHPAGSVEYAELLATCKVETSVYFALAEWDGDRPVIIWPDGLGWYRLRTTSRHSVRALIGSLDLVAGFTGGLVAGVPFDLSLRYIEVAGPEGAKRRIPVWSFVMRPPAGLRLTGRSFRVMAGAAIEEARQIQLAMPPGETLEERLLEPGEGALALLESGDAPDAAYWRKRFHAMADDTWYETDEGRAAFLRLHTRGRSESLAEVISQSTNEQLAALCDALQGWVDNDPRGESLRRALAQLGAIVRADPRGRSRGCAPTAVPAAPGEREMEAQAAAPAQAKSGAGVGFHRSPAADVDERSMQALFGHALPPRQVPGYVEAFPAEQQADAPSAEYAADFEPDSAYDLEPATEAEAAYVAAVEGEREAGADAERAEINQWNAAAAEQAPAPAPTYTCEGCGQDLVPWTNPATGEVAQPAEIAERTRAKYGEILCPMCATARTAKTKKQR